MSNNCLTDITDKYLTASFKGVEFVVVNNIDTVVGRDGVVHEYANRDFPYFEDFKRSPRIFDMTATFSSNDGADLDHVQRADLLIEACESKGSGVFIHPQYGEYDVRCTRCTLSDSASGMGSTSIRLNFVEAGEYVAAAQAVDVNASEFILDSRAIVVPLVESEYQGSIIATPITIGQLNDNINNYITPRFTTAIGGNSATIPIPIPELTIRDIAAEVTDTFNLISNELESEDEIFKSLGSFKDITNDQILAENVVTQQIERSKQLQNLIVEVGALYSYSEVATDTPTETGTEAQKQAIAMDTWYTDVISTADNLVDDKQIIDELQLARSSTMKQMYLNIVNSPTAITYNVQGPTVLQAHEIYGNYRRYDDIEGWNGIKDPLFPNPNIMVNLSGS